MWIFDSDSFVSIVADRNNPDNLLVRARFEGDIERALGEALVDEGVGVSRTPAADYLFRVSISRAAVGRVLANRLADLMHENFKNSVRDEWRHDDLMRVWSIMHSRQHERLGGGGSRFVYPYTLGDDDDDALEIDRLERMARGEEP